ncbi:lipid II flippase MurJ [Pseudonocardia sp. ICBG1142]|uniref:lipid II flippase MurJ n=1 Tax=Pseudonocardia sp. ICBG1142 TaxID=2846760 RepID=UPI002105CA23|nr:lipid II flippase MurJ [Pseudonocardia sp. ICBG1142]
MLQIRVFYAQGDSRTPTLIQLWLITLKVPLLLLCPMVLPSEQVVIGIAAVNSLSFIWAAIASQWLLRRKMGEIPISEVLDFLWRVSLSAGLSAVAARGALDGGRAAAGDLPRPRACVGSAPCRSPYLPIPYFCHVKITENAQH